MLCVTEPTSSVQKETEDGAEIPYRKIPETQLSEKPVSGIYMQAGFMPYKDCGCNIGEGLLNALSI